MEIASKCDSFCRKVIVGKLGQLEVDDAIARDWKFVRKGGGDAFIKARSAIGDGLRVRSRHDLQCSEDPLDHFSEVFNMTVQNAWVVDF